MQHAETRSLRVVAPSEARKDDASDEAVAGGSVDAGLPSPGRYIMEQRKRQGMSIDQLAAATKIPRSSIEFLEADQHDALPGPVFVKGFLRCCARALGVEAETVMELVYEREREMLVARRRERPVAPDAALSAPAPSDPSSTKASSKVAKTEAPREPKTPSAEADAPPAEAGPEGAAPQPLFDLGAITKRLGRSGVSFMLWFAVAVFVAMVMMAAWNALGQTPLGPT